MPDFTPQESRILNKLADGRPHSRDELLECLDDELSDKISLLMSISRIRKKLKPHNQYIHCIEGKPPFYVHLTSAPALPQVS